MTQTFGTNASNDLYLGPDGNLVVLSSLPAVTAACESTARAILAEMIYQVNKGIPYFESVFIGSPNYAIFRSYLIQAFLAVDGVLSVQSLTLTVDKGVLHYQATIQTQFGSGVISNG